MHIMQKLPKAILDEFKRQGAKGGKIGGPLSAARLTPAQRRKRARAAGLASAAARKRRKGEAA